MDSKAAMRFHITDDNKHARQRGWHNADWRWWGLWLEAQRSGTHMLRDRGSETYVGSRC